MTKKTEHGKVSKIFMHWDMEGVSGIFTRKQVWYWEEQVKKRDVEEGRQLLIADINSAVASALRAEAKLEKVIVSDTHHGGGNIILDQMLQDPRVTYQGPTGVYKGENRWMPGLDETVDGFFLLGHHAKAGTEGAFLPHTETLKWADFRINGQSVGEIGIEACFAGHWDIPTIMVQGDKAACEEAERLFPGITTASVKRAVTHDFCTGLEPEAARRLTAKKVAEALEKLRKGQCKPYKPQLPMTVSVQMKRPEMVDVASMKAGVERIDEYTIQCRIEQQCDVVKWITGGGLKTRTRR